jgi:molybdate transport repressor ModE-like protein
MVKQLSASRFCYATNMRNLIGTTADAGERQAAIGHRLTHSPHFMIRDRPNLLMLVPIMKKTPVPTATTVAAPNLSIRINLGKNVRIGPGKVALLEEIEKKGSISGGGRALKMSYRRAWELIEEMNQTLGIAVVETATGGAGGGGTRLTDADERSSTSTGSLRRTRQRSHVGTFPASWRSVNRHKAALSAELSSQENGASARWVVRMVQRCDRSSANARDEASAIFDPTCGDGQSSWIQGHPIELTWIVSYQQTEFSDCRLSSECDRKQPCLLSALIFARINAVLSLGRRNGHFSRI